jgi:3-hydroxypropanoate dehydrogenase
MPLAVDPKALDTLVLKARSHNAWLDKPVPDALLRELYDIARQGPSSSNCQPMRIVFVRAPEGKDKLAPALSSTNRAKTLAAPVIAIIAYSLDFAPDLDRFYHVPGARNWYTSSEALIEETGLRNSSIQGAFFIVAARAVGLDCGPMSGFSNAKVDAAFFPDARWKSNFLCSLGYGDPAALYPDMGRRTFEETCRFA